MAPLFLALTRHVPHAPARLLAIQAVHVSAPPVRVAFRAEMPQAAMKPATAAVVQAPVDCGAGTNSGAVNEASDGVHADPAIAESAAERKTRARSGVTADSCTPIARSVLRARAPDERKGRSGDPTRSIARAGEMLFAHPHR